MSSDEELFRDGGGPAMTQLVGRYERPMFRFLFQATGDAQMAEDLFQETFLRLHRARQTFQPGQPLKPYLYRIALNVLNDVCARKRPVVLSAIASKHDSSGGETEVFGERLSSSLPGPHDEFERGETREKVRAALDALPENERTVVLLRIFEGLTFPEIARITDAPVATTKSRLLYALRRLRPVMEAYLGGGSVSQKKETVS